MEALDHDLRIVCPLKKRACFPVMGSNKSWSSTRSPEETRIFDAMQAPSQLEAVKQAANITGDSGKLKVRTQLAASSAFESAKQRFVGDLFRR
ncbi:hypothetical protein [Bradyrhizobium sp. USDA 3650]